MAAILSRGRWVDTKPPTEWSGPRASTRCMCFLTKLYTARLDTTEWIEIYDLNGLSTSDDSTQGKLMKQDFA